MHIKKKRGARILALSLNANFCSWHKAEKNFNENLKQYFVRENHQTKFTTKELSLFLSDGHGAALREARRTRSAQTQQRGLTLGNLKPHLKKAQLKPRYASISKDEINFCF